MMLKIITNILFALFLTIIVESIVAYFFEFKGKKAFYVVSLMNIITNLSLNCLLLIYDTFLIVDYRWMLILILELIIVYVEYRILWMYVKMKKALYMSVVMNLFSFLFGLLVFL